MKKYIVILVACLTFGACEEEEKTPDYIISEEKFVEVLTDIQKAESIVRLGYTRSADSSYVNDSVYAAVFRKQGVSRADFDSSMNHYLNNLDQMEGIYDQVLENISKESAELKAKRKNVPKSHVMD